MILLSKIIKKLWIFHSLPCLGTILASNCPASCQPSSASPPSSGSIVAALSHLSSCSMMAPMPFCAVAPAPSPSESGSGTRSVPLAASRPARLWMLSLAARVAAADSWVRAQAVLPQPSGSHFQTRWSLHLLLRHWHETVLELFSCPARRFWLTR